MIRVRCVDLISADQNVYDRLYALATPERKDRADRCLRQGDKLRCVAADALLRTALGTGDYRVAKGGWGKPYIPDRPDFHFNLSHSGRYVVLAWGDREMGVDVQRHNPAADTLALAARYFAPGERDYARQDPRYFYEIWAKKESCLKYAGTGLHQDLRSFNVLDPEPGIRYWYRALGEDYSLSLCAGENAVSFELLDVRQLL